MTDSVRKKWTRARLGWLVVIFAAFWVLLAVGIAKVWIKAQVLGLTSVEITKLYIAIERERMRQNELISQRALLLDPRRLAAEAKNMGMVLPEVEEETKSSGEAGNAE